MNEDGTISPIMNRDLVLGLHPNLKDGSQPLTNTALALETLFANRPDLLQYTQVYDSPNAELFVFLCFFVAVVAAVLC